MNAELPLERARHLRELPGEPLPEACSRLYAGDDFCERLLPEAEELRRLAEQAADRGLRFTFLTPYCTEDGMENLKRAFGVLAPFGCEVVVNDPGVLRVLNRDFQSLTPVLGRLYTSLLLPPYFDDRRVFGRGGALRSFRMAKLNLSDSYFSFLKTNRISRAEFDNVFAPPLFGDRFSSEGIKLSLYLPFTYISTTRRCLFAPERGVSTKLALLGCARGCLEQRMLLEGGHYPDRRIHVIGNAQFLKNGSGWWAHDWRKWGVDRVVDFAR
ncbi:MAG: hypothetical protein NDI60_04010 [Elusimicrobiales bacterium]|nr:hypothetical protein [Elusimicrobiales bacterium]